MRITWSLVVLLLLAGCATSEQEKSTQPAVRVTVYREPSPRDGLFPMLFIVDGRVIAQLQPEEKASFELDAGSHRFEYELGLYNCSAQVRLESGKAYAYRLAQGCVIALEDEP